MSDNKELEISKQNQSLVDTTSNAPMGFEDEEAGDFIIPRIKVVNALSPERKDKKADEGDIINSLTVEKYNGKIFIPVYKFNSNILWKDRADGGGILCIARDGKVGTETDGSCLICKQCKKNEFDNSKSGKDAIPKCTKYINFFGFFEGEPMPIVLSFAKTNYNEGKKLYSLAKVTMQNMWNYGYRLESKLFSKNGNEWYNIIPTSAGATSDENRMIGEMLYKSYRTAELKFDMENGEESSTPSNASQQDIETAEF